MAVTRTAPAPTGAGAATRQIKIDNPTKIDNKESTMTISTHTIQSWDIELVGFRKFATEGHDDTVFHGQLKRILCDAILVKVTLNGGRYTPEVELRGWRVKADGEMGSSLILRQRSLRLVPADVREQVIGHLNVQGPTVWTEEGNLTQDKDEQRSIATRIAAARLQAEWNNPRVQAELSKIGVGPLTVETPEARDERHRALAVRRADDAAKRAEEQRITAKASRTNRKGAGK